MDEHVDLAVLPGVERGRATAGLGGEVRVVHRERRVVGRDVGRRRGGAGRAAGPVDGLDVERDLFGRSRCRHGIDGCGEGGQNHSGYDHDTEHDAPPNGPRCLFITKIARGTDRSAIATYSTATERSNTTTRSTGNPFPAISPLPAGQIGIDGQDWFGPVSCRSENGGVAPASRASASSVEARLPRSANRRATSAPGS